MRYMIEFELPDNDNIFQEIKNAYVSWAVWGYSGICRATPSIDVAKVRHGKWCKKNYWSAGIGMGESYGYWYSCSECGKQVKGGYDR